MPPKDPTSSAGATANAPLLTAPSPGSPLGASFSDLGGDNSAPVLPTSAATTTALAFTRRRLNTMGRNGTVGDLTSFAATAGAPGGDNFADTVASQKYEGVAGEGDDAAAPLLEQSLLAGTMPTQRSQRTVAFAAGSESVRGGAARPTNDGGSLWSRWFGRRGTRKPRLPLRDAHHFTPDELKKMAAFDGIDYWEPINDLYVQHLAERHQQHRYFKWVIYCFVGVAVGVWSIILFHSIDAITDAKLDIMNDAIRRYDAYVGYAVYMLWGVVSTFLATVVCAIYPGGAGSGVPDVMAFLNGVSLPDAMRPMVILVKTFSCMMGVTAGMAVGGEGPMIHIGALLGSELSSGRSRWRWLNDLMLPVFRPFRNSKDHRDFTTAGTAAGVTSVFGSPLGGLLFVFEELASFMPPKVAWMTFCACIICFLTSQVGATYFDDWKPVKIPRFDVEAFTVNELSTVLFNQNVSPFGQVPFSVLSIAPAVAVGVFLGAIAGVFIRAHLFIARRWRAAIVNKSTLRKMLEPVATAFVYCTLCYVLSATMPCSEIPPFMVNTTDAGLKQLKLHTSLCAENRGHFDEPTHFSMMGTLALTGSYNTIRICLSRNTGHYFSDPIALGVYFTLYTTFACFTAGQFFASGIVIPTLVMGATGARLLIGQVTRPWGDPGVLALVGMGAYFSGLSRLTFSLVVILAEISNDLQNLIVVMIGITTARYVANKIAHSLYHEQLQMRGVPFLDFDTQVHKLDCFCMRDIMTPAPEALPIVTDVETLREVAASKHHAFPVVRHAVAADDELRQREDESGSVRVASGSVHALGSAARAASVSAASGPQDGGLQELAVGEEYTFLGLISRDLVSLLLWHFDLAEASAPGEEAQMPSYRDLEEIREQQHFFEGVPPPPQNLAGANAAVRNARLIDLTPFIDTSAPFVQQGMAISRGYNLYRSMSLRHLCVVDSQNQLTGLVTRRNLLGHFMNERLKEKMSAVSMMVRANKE